MRRFFLAIMGAIAIVSLLAACDGSTVAQSTTAKTAASVEANQDKLLTATPIPILGMSQERENLVKRAKRINVQNMTSCITLFSQTGAVVGFFPVAGKVSSLNSYLLPGDRIVPNNIPHYSDQESAFVVESPDIDGAYGKNADGIFFFTADTDAYVEWVGDYFWSDACLAPTTEPLLISTTP